MDGEIRSRYLLISSNKTHYMKYQPNTQGGDLFLQKFQSQVYRGSFSNKRMFKNKFSWGINAADIKLIIAGNR